jgi:methylphosphotriester-DNA--protein-cysteine methyltransferase
MLRHSDITASGIIRAIKKKEICFGGNLKLKIYGTLRCRSGKRMNKENRVFFLSEQQAIDEGFRPYGNCMKKEYTAWTYSKIL